MSNFTTIYLVDGPSYSYTHWIEVLKVKTHIVHSSTFHSPTDLQL